MAAKATKTEGPDLKGQAVEAGELWLSNIKGAEPFTVPGIDSNLISQYAENKYIKEGLYKQERILFEDAIEIKIIDVASGETDDDLTFTVNDMLSTHGVDLNDTIKGIQVPKVEKTKNNHENTKCGKHEKRSVSSNSTTHGSVPAWPVAGRPHLDLKIVRPVVYPPLAAPEATRVSKGERHSKNSINAINPINSTGVSDSMTLRRYDSMTL